MREHARHPLTDTVSLMDATGKGPSGVEYDHVHREICVEQA